VLVGKKVFICICLAAGFLVTVPIIQAQTVSPVIVEYREKAKSSLQIRNDQLIPLDVVLEPHSFTVDREGEPHYGPLDPQVHLKLSTMSFRLAPQQTYTVFYEATADRLPVWFTIYATVSAAVPNLSQSGIKVAYQIPHTVYLLDKDPLPKEAIQCIHSGLPGADHAFDVEISNQSRQFARVQEVEVRSSSDKKTYPGFPFFPGTSRVMHLKWDGKGNPQRVILKFEHFHVEWPLTAAGEVSVLQTPKTVAVKQ
jgi:pyruvate/2-oxoacid:ferredoxin oxidoreductase alpha subunit